MINKLRMQKMESALHSSFNPTYLSIVDDSESHLGHAGALTGKGHFILEIESLTFKGKTQVAIHQMIYKALGDLMENDIHALSIKARIPKD